MTFPDQRHVNTVRDALHQRSGSGASVMVGSGFSRNATPVLADSRQLPTWQEVANQLRDKLYPDNRKVIYRECESPRATESSPRIAQEFEAAFGRVALRDALHRLVRDGEFSPSTEHRRLLRLPWRDVYTTNWDTLLEQAAKQVREQAYRVVSNTDHIPMAAHPWVVKLHGSLQTQFPLVVTEEDYRTYPARSAPFVNTVQQAMMETVFCLIGFSGDDPNFLTWSGWVRDNLGASASRIYLAGWLDLSGPRRQMLESRNVMPIDLSCHPRGNEWPENMRDRYATEWLLHSLEQGRSYNISKWPNRRERSNLEQIDPILEPIARPEHVKPRIERYEPKNAKRDMLAEIRLTIEDWRHNRSVYPGWVTVPFSKRYALVIKTGLWKQHILRFLTKLNPVERLNAIRELTWREEFLQVQTSEQLECAIDRTLELFDCQERVINGESAPDADWVAIRESWRKTATILVTAARFRLDRLLFEARIKALAPFEDEDRDIWHRLRHEECLWAISDLDFETLDSLLGEWQTESCDPIWMIRKSAVLMECGRFGESDRLRNHAINQIRAMPHNERSLSAESWESWALIWTRQSEDLNTIRGRNEELAQRGCDPSKDLRAIVDRLEINSPEEKPPAFDLHTRRIPGYNVSNYDPQAAAYYAIRLSELAGLPPFVDHRLLSTVSANLLTSAATRLADSNANLAIRILLRACSSSSDKSINYVLSRGRIATLPTADAHQLTKACIRLIDNRLAPRSRALSPFRISVALESLSRLVFRVEHDHRTAIVHKALDVCQTLARHPAPISTSVRNLLKRSWETLPDVYRREHAIELLVLPIAGLDFELGEHSARSWPDPVDALQLNDEIPERTQNNESLWQQCVDLLVRGLGSNPTARRRASRRLTLLATDQLKGPEAIQIAQALWCERYTESIGLPSDTDLCDGAFLTLPEPKPGLALDRFRDKWLSHGGVLGKGARSQSECADATANTKENNLRNDPGKLEDRLWQIGNAINLLRAKSESLLRDREKPQVVELIGRWTDAPTGPFPDVEYYSYFPRQEVRAVADVLPAILGEIVLPNEICVKLIRKIGELIEQKVPAFQLAASLVRCVPERASDIATTFRVGLMSLDQAVAAGAVWGVKTWIDLASENQAECPEPPEHLVRVIGIWIAARRRNVLSSALEVARWIFEKGTQAHKDCIRDLVQDGLHCLAEELSYDRDKAMLADIPLLRLASAQLAVTMAKDGLERHPSVARWLELAAEDPLPEVQNVI